MWCEVFMRRTRLSASATRIKMLHKLGKSIKFCCCYCLARHVVCCRFFFLFSSRSSSWIPLIVSFQNRRWINCFLSDCHRTLLTNPLLTCSLFSASFYHSNNEIVNRKRKKKSNQIIYSILLTNEFSKRNINLLQRVIIANNYYFIGVKDASGYSTE